MNFRSLLFVPGDRPERFAKAERSGADAIILDLEDSVASERKAAARNEIGTWLKGESAVPSIVRLNPLGSEHLAADLDFLGRLRPSAVMLPKAVGASSIFELTRLFGEHCPPIVPITCETPDAVFEIGSFRQANQHLAALTWGAEDLQASLGAVSARCSDGRYTPPFAIVRSMTLLGAHAAKVAAFETVYPNIKDLTGLAAHVERARRDGFTGMLAIHPSQIATINAGFSPSDAEIARAAAIVKAFEEDCTLGAVQIEGKMIDRPHLVQARAVIERARLH